MNNFLVEEGAAVNVFDFSSLEDLDPSLSGGYRIVYDREIPLEVRYERSDEELRHGSIETIKMKILIQGIEEDPTSIRLEISSEADLFFHYCHALEQNGYRKVQESQKLIVDFGGYPEILVRMLNACVREPHAHTAVFTMYSESDARLDFIQNMEYKFVELMSCNFSQSSQETIQHHITYRYNSIKQRLNIMQAKLSDINSLVKTKNPSLLLQLQKTNSPAIMSNHRR
jgi:hypothetical protein|mmetsp:Transcript_30457/g.29079  ORF Transcript_30457/g.29079 Transcript_30457/m.29079 type:complete len:228 (-) Transcript_30457:441-1124(-)